MINDNLDMRMSTMEDVEFLKDKLRQNDIQEMWDSGHKTPEVALKEGLSLSDICITVFDDNGPIAMAGITNNGVIWMLSTDEIDKHKKGAMLIGRMFIKECMKSHQVLYNYVCAENIKAIGFLKKLGADIKEPAPYGVESKDFSFFSIGGK